MYLGKVEIHHKDLFKTPDMYTVRDRGGKLFKSKKQAVSASKRIGRIKVSTRKYPIGSHMAYSAEKVNVVNPKKVKHTNFGYNFGDYY